jgi:hypothetical protein
MDLKFEIKIKVFLRTIEITYEFKFICSPIVRQFKQLEN